MTVLTVDRGNSLCKAVIWKDGSIADFSQSSGQIESFLSEIIDRWSPDGCVIGSVGNFDPGVQKRLLDYFKDRFLVLTPDTKLPFKLYYTSVSSLGVDRIAGVAGASHFANGKACLVVDSGTALTIDLVDDSGNFMGGNISPGMRLRFKSLHEATSRLPLVNADGEIPAFGHDTLTAIRSGVIVGMADEILGAFGRAWEKYGEVTLLITGGDAEIIEKELSGRNINANVDPFLVSRGLKIIFDYNMSLK